MTAEDKPIVWLRGEIKSPPFSKGARLEAGFLLRQLQQGETLSLPHSRPMPGIDQGVHELRINDRNLTWRIIYRIDNDAIVIGDVFSKKSRETPEKVIRTCKDRFNRYDTAAGE